MVKCGLGRLRAKTAPLGSWGRKFVTLPGHNPDHRAKSIRIALKIQTDSNQHSDPTRENTCHPRLKGQKSVLSIRLGTDYKNSLVKPIDNCAACM